MQAVGSSDRELLTELYTKHGSRVYARCLYLLRDKEEARDAMHDVFVQLLSHRERLSAEAPASLLWQIATRICLNRIRGARRSREKGDGEDALLEALADLPDETERTGARAILQRLFRGELPSTRVIAVLHYVDGMTLEETADEVGLSVSGVRKRLRTLRARLGALVPDEVSP